MQVNRKKLKKIWESVPVDYYQKGVEQNIFQRIWHYGKLNAIRQCIGTSPKIILDVGCASGWFLHQIAHKYPNVICHGIDIYKRAIMYGKKKYPNINFYHGDAHNLPFDNDSIDLIICAETLEHVENPKKVLKEINRVISPKGSVIIEMDTGNILFNIIWNWWTNIRNGVWKDAHLHSFNSQKLKQLILKSGFSILSEKRFNYTMAVVFSLTKR